MEVVHYAEFACPRCEWTWVAELPPLDEVEDWPSCTNDECSDDTPGRLMWVLAPSLRV